jgi:hypothetical protein
MKRGDRLEPDRPLTHTGVFQTMALVSDAGDRVKADSANLPLLRFEGLREQGIVKTWHTLNHWIDTKGFPAGRLIGRHRTWTVAEVMAWIERQSAAKAELRGVAKQLAANS